MDEDLADIVRAQIVLHRELLVEVDIHCADVRHRSGEILLGDSSALPAPYREAQEVGDVDDIDLSWNLPSKASSWRKASSSRGTSSTEIRFIYVRSVFSKKSTIYQSYCKVLPVFCKYADT